MAVALHAPDPDRAREAAALVVSTLSERGYTAYLAGGCVRDRLMGRTPIDYDVATDAKPDTVEACFPHSVTTGKAFGVVRVPTPQGPEIEVATFRSDHGYDDGRHPRDVTFTTAREDAQRRDFTVNALFYDIGRDMVIDYVDGRRDLDAHLLRCVGTPDERFREDHLRLLRAARFAAVLELDIEPATAAAVERNAESIRRVASERIRDELTRILLEAPAAGRAIELLDRLNLLQHVLPEVKAMQGVEQPAEFHPEGDVFRHTVLMLDMMVNPSPRLAWTVLLHDVGKPGTMRLTPSRIRFDRHANVGADLAVDIMKRLRFSGDDTRFVARCVHDHMRTLEVPNMRRSTLRRMVGADTFPVELELHRLDCLASHGSLDNYDMLKQFLEAMRNEPVLPAPWVTGRDVIELGVAEGPAVGEWLQKAYDVQLEGRCSDREALRKWLASGIRRSS